jgi:hypothetical protein
VSFGPGFSESVTRLIGHGNIHRVYDIADPVPMVPFYPYVHAPAYRDGLRVDGPGVGISIGAHSMPDNYFHRASGTSWKSLESASSGHHGIQDVDYWLDQAKGHVNFPGSSAAL